MKKIGTLFLVALVGGLVSIGMFKIFDNKEIQQVIIEKEVKVPSQYSSIISSEGLTDFTLAAEKTVNSVVHVFTEQEMEQAYNPWAEMFGYDQSGSQIQRGSGSGVIISNNGYIVTNNHVIEGADRIKVNLNNNTIYDAEIIGSDPSSDLALLKIEGNNFEAVSFGNSDDLKVGEWVLAVGNPFNLASTVTAGIVSAKGRDIDLLQPDYYNQLTPVESFIQTDAAVNPGNSGGALVNSKGQLVGINTAIASMTGSYSGYSFAIPVTIVQKVTKDLMDFGSVQRAFIGVHIANVNQDIAEEIGMNEINGIYVTEPIENSAAFEAGVETGDVIKKVDGIVVKNVPELQEVLSRFRPGDEVQLDIWRAGEMKNLKLILRNKEGNTELRTKEENLLAELGAEFTDIPNSIQNKLKLHGGVQVNELKNGRLKQSGIKEDFIITHIGDYKVYDQKDLSTVLNNQSGGVLISGIYPDGKEAFYALNLR